MAEDTTYDLIAATGCPTGIAHTYMAKEALEKAAAAKGLTIKVETHGQVGIENEVTPRRSRLRRPSSSLPTRTFRPSASPASPW